MFIFMGMMHSFLRAPLCRLLSALRVKGGKPSGVKGREGKHSGVKGMEGKPSGVKGRQGPAPPAVSSCGIQEQSPAGSSAQVWLGRQEDASPGNQGLCFMPKKRGGDLS